MQFFYSDETYQETLRTQISTSNDKEKNTIVVGVANRNVLLGCSGYDAEKTKYAFLQIFFVTISEQCYGSYIRPIVGRRREVVLVA